MESCAAAKILESRPNKRCAKWRSWRPRGSRREISWQPAQSLGAISNKCIYASPVLFPPNTGHENFGKFMKFPASLLLVLKILGDRVDMTGNHSGPVPWNCCWYCKSLPFKAIVAGFRSEVAKKIGHLAFQVLLIKSSLFRFLRPWKFPWTNPRRNDFEPPPQAHQLRSTSSGSVASPGSYTTCVGGPAPGGKVGVATPQKLAAFLYGCFLKWWYPQKNPKWSFLARKPWLLGTTILGNPHLWDCQGLPFEIKDSPRNIP